MTKNEELVDFVARDGVTVYTGRSVAGHAPGSVVSLPKSHADGFAHLHAHADDSSAKPAATAESD